MKLHLLRFHSDRDYTLGLLFNESLRRTWLCYTLEDEQRTQKVYGETRIPEGNYSITLRTIGGFHGRYGAKFGELHKGMLWLQDVPGFDYVLIHIGNDEDDTAGCILVGDTSERGFIGQSALCYQRVYPQIAEAILSGDTVTLEVTDYA